MNDKKKTEKRKKKEKQVVKPVVCDLDNSRRDTKKKQHGLISGCNKKKDKAPKCDKIMTAKDLYNCTTTTNNVKKIPSNPSDKSAVVGSQLIRKSSDPCIDEDERIAPKKMTIKNREVDQEAASRIFKKLTAKAQTPKTATPPCPLDLKSQLVLDRVVTKKAAIKYKYVAKKQHARLATLDDDAFFGTKPGEEKKEEDDGKKLKEKKSTTAIEKEDSYSSYPKLEDVKKLPEEDIFIQDGKTDWLIDYFPTDDDKVGVEEACSVTSENVTDYQMKKLELTNPPEMGMTLDGFGRSATMKTRDKLFFTSQMVFSNTLRSLINVTAETKEAKEKKKKKKKLVVVDGMTIERIKDTQSEEDAISFVAVDKAHCARYSRNDPIGSVRKWKEANPD